MKLRHLRAFVAVAANGSFVGAARELKQVQAALSKQVAALESELGARLFVRGPREVLLTEAGEALIGEARRLVELSDLAVASARAAAGRAAGTLRLAYAEMLRSHESILASTLAALGTRHPRLTVTACRMSSAQQWRAIRDREIQVGLGYGEPPDAQGLAHAPLASVSVTNVLLPADHPLASAPGLRFRDLAGLPLLLFPREVNPPLHDWLLAGLEARGLQPSLRPWMLSRAAHEEAVRAGHGWTLATEALPASPPGVAVREVADPPLSTALSLWWAADREDPSVGAFVETAMSTLAASRGGRTTHGWSGSPPPEPARAPCAG